MVTSQADLMAEKITGMDRSHLVQLLKQMHCDFAIDFTDEYLSSISLERLQHVVLAVALHADNQSGRCV